MFNIKDFLSGSSNGKIVNFDKDTVLETIQPTGFQLYFLHDAWRMAVVNADTKMRLAFNISKIDVPKAIQLAATALNDASKVLDVTPNDSKAKAVVIKQSPVVAAWVAECFDDENHYIYAGETEAGRKFCVLSPNAPGSNTGIATVAFSSSLVGA